jgi:hypothetical protein
MRHLFCIMAVVAALASLAACGEISTVGNPTNSDSGGSSAGGDTGTGTDSATFDNTIDTGTAAMKQVPPIDPNAADSAQTVSASSLSAKSVWKAEGDSINDEDYSMEKSTGSDSLDILVTQTAPTESTKAGLVEMFQCAGDSQGTYVSVQADNTDADTVQYAVRMINTASFSGDDLDVTFVGDTDGKGTLSGSRTTTVNGSQSGTAYSVKFGSDGTTNTLTAHDGTRQIMCVWNTSGVGCGKVDSGETIPFSFTTDSDGKRTYETAEDTLCSSLPEALSVATAPEGLTGDRAYDCGQPASCTLAAPASAIALEDAGGTQCAELGGHWKRATVDASECSDATTATGVGCHCDALYAKATQAVRGGTRSGLCKVMGLANNGDIDLGARDASASVCVQDLQIGN